MATITNIGCEFRLGIVGALGELEHTVIDGRRITLDRRRRYQVELDPRIFGKPSPQVKLDDECARDWEKRTPWCRMGKVAITYDRAVPKPEPELLEPATETETETLEVAPDDGPGRPHWRAAIRMVNECESLDKLEQMLSAEERPAVRKAIGQRMEELHA